MPPTLGMSHGSVSANSDTDEIWASVDATWNYLNLRDSGDAGDVGNAGVDLFDFESWLRDSGGYF